MRIKQTLIECSKACTNASLFLLKLPLQLAGCIKRPELFIDTLQGNRYPVYLSIALAAEFVIEIRINDLLFFSRRLPLRDFLLRTVVLLPWRTPVAPVVLSRESEYPFPSKQAIIIDGDYYSVKKRATSHLIMPYFAHPEFYRHRLHLKPPVFHPGPRPFRILFCGTIVKAGYSQSFHFPILNRYEVMDYIIEHFAEHIAKSAQGPKMPITILSTDDPDNTIKKHSLSPVRYFQALCHADFFIAPPGTFMPHCHNIIEAMTAGAIPITNYGHYFDPPLQNEINCLAFNTLDELDQALRKAIDMSPEQIDALRKGTMDYYERHLKPSSFGAAFRQSWSPSTHLVVNMERPTYGLPDA